MDDVYQRHGVIDVFVAFEPLAAKWIVKVTETRKTVDFAYFVRELVDTYYSHAEKSYWPWIS